jgi:hypothetical protein
LCPKQKSIITLAFGWGQRAVRQIVKGWNMKKLIVLCVLIFVVGCQSGQEIANSWVGGNINDFIASNGPPAQVFENGAEGKMYVFRRGGPVTMPGYANTTYSAFGSHTTYQPGQTFYISHSVTLWVSPQGTITRAAYSNR